MSIIENLQRLLTILFLLSLSSFNYAAGKVSIEPYLTQSYGSVFFRLEVAQPLRDDTGQSSDVDVIGRSELEYPLDVRIFGLKLSNRFFSSDDRKMTSYIKVWKNFSDPGEKMQDSDWVGVKSGSATSLYKFSYTQSRSDIEWAGIETGLAINNYKVLKRPASIGVSILVDYSYHRMYGITGWQKTPDTVRINIDELHDSLVLTYQLLTIQPALFTNIIFSDKDKLKWTGLFSILPIVIAKDKDDHVLRNKISKTTAIGIGFTAATQLQYKIDRNLALMLDAEMRFFRSSGEMTQTFYGNDPGTDENDTGLVLPGIDNIISLFTQQVSMVIQYRF